MDSSEMTAEETTSPTYSDATQERVTKDPKKVAAGRKGAAARKAKQAVALEQLRRAKEDLKASQTTQPRVAVETAPESPEPSAWIAYAVLIGTAAIAVGAVLYTQKSAGPVANRSDARAKASPNPTTEKTVLDTRSDPFYMH